MPGPRPCPSSQPSLESINDLRVQSPIREDGRRTSRARVRREPGRPDCPIGTRGPRRSAAPPGASPRGRSHDARTRLLRSPGSGPRRDARGHQEGLPRPGAEVPSRRQSGRQDGRVEVQGSPAGLRHPVRRGEAGAVRPLRRRRVRGDGRRRAAGRRVEFHVPVRRAGLREHRLLPVLRQHGSRRRRCDDGRGGDAGGGPLRGPARPDAAGRSGPAAGRPGDGGPPHHPVPDRRPRRRDDDRGPARRRADREPGREDPAGRRDRHEAAAQGAGRARRQGVHRPAI